MVNYHEILPLSVRRKAMPRYAAFILLVLLAESTLPAWSASTRFRFDQDNVPGWSLMTSAERAAHHQKLLSLKTLSECSAYMEAHRNNMEERAKERNRTLRAARFDVCEQMKSQGLIE
jgi:hypothetical protein